MNMYVYNQKERTQNTNFFLFSCFGQTCCCFFCYTSLRTRPSFDRLWRNLLAPPLSLLQVLLLTLNLLLLLPPLPVLRLIRDLAPDPFRAAILVVPDVAIPSLRGERGHFLLPSYLWFVFLPFLFSFPGRYMFSSVSKKKRFVFLARILFLGLGFGLNLLRSFPSPFQ